MMILLSGISPTWAASPQINSWTRTYGGAGDEEAWGVQQTSDGGYVVVGWTTSFGSEGFDIWVLRLDRTNRVIWQNAYGTPGFDVAYSIEETVDGGFILTGSTGSVSPGGYNQIWVLRLDPRGNIVWQKAYTGPYVGESFFVRQASDGGFVVAAGIADAFGPRHEDVSILRLDAHGDVIWWKAYGGDGKDLVSSVLQTADGGFIAVGLTASFGSAGAWVLKLASSGSVEWQRVYVGALALSIKQTSDGGYIIAGISGSIINDAWILRLDTSGNVVWQREYGGDGVDDAFSIDETSDGGFVVAGFTKSFGGGGAWVFKLDYVGNVVWERSYGGPGLNDAFFVQGTFDGGFIVAGATSEFGIGRTEDAWLLKLAPDGSICNCRLEASSHSKVTDTTAIIRTTTAVPVDIEATVINTNGAAMSTHAAPRVQCPGQR